jgi:syntaxin-binding protein 1
LPFFLLLCSATAAAADEDSEYAASRYVPPLKQTLEQFAQNSLSMEDYPSVMPMPEQTLSTPKAQITSARAQSARSSRRTGGSAQSARKSGASSRWSKSSGPEGKRSAGPTNFQGGRCMVFMIGGLCYPELRVAREVMEAESREIIMGSTAFLSPNEYLEDLEKLGTQRDD